MDMWLVVVGVAAASLGGAALVALLRRASRARMMSRTAQEVEIVVRHGYAPDRVEVRNGSNVRITFDRREDGECTEWVIFPGLDIACWLPAFRRTTLNVELPAPGRYEFRCRLGVCRGHLVVRA